MPSDRRASTGLADVGPKQVLCTPSRWRVPSGGLTVLRSLTRPEHNNRSLPDIRRTVTSTSRRYVLLGAVVVSKKCVVLCSGDSRVRIFRILAFMNQPSWVILGVQRVWTHDQAICMPKRPSSQTRTKHALVGYCLSLAIFAKIYIYRPHQ